MSKRNSYAAKESARERLRAERAKQAKKDKVKRQLTVAGGAVALLAIAGGIGYAVMQANKPGAWETAADRKLVVPANTSGKNGTSIVIGNPAGKHTLKVYEDLRCPVCAVFEQKSGETVQQLAKAGKYKIAYTMGTFLDGNLKGTGSKNALSALGAALNISKDAFVQYHKVLYSKSVHPEETDDAFGSDANLVKYAQQVPALKGNKKFEDAVDKGTFDKWALTMSDQFDKEKIQGTPTVKLDGTVINAVQQMTPAQFTATIEKQLGR
jgi:protein-disulfide isomerase